MEAHGAFVRYEFNWTDKSCDNVLRDDYIWAVQRNDASRHTGTLDVLLEVNFSNR